MGCKDKFLRVAGPSAAKRVLLARFSVRDVAEDLSVSTPAHRRGRVWCPVALKRGLWMAQACFGRSGALVRPSPGRAFWARSRRLLASGAVKARHARKSEERSCRAHGLCARPPGCRASVAATRLPATRLPGKATLAAAAGTPKTAACAAT